MVFGLILIGVLLLDTGFKGTQRELGQRLQDDMLGQQGFVGWAAAFFAIGAIGYIPTLEKPSRYFIALMLVVIVLRNGGVFQQFKDALATAAKAGPAVSTASPVTSGDTEGSGSSSGSGSSGGGGSGASTAVSTIAKLAPLALAFL